MGSLVVTKTNWREIFNHEHKENCCSTFQHPESFNIDSSTGWKKGIQLIYWWKWNGREIEFLWNAQHPNWSCILKEQKKITAKYNIFIYIIKHKKKLPESLKTLLQYTVWWLILTIRLLPHTTVDQNFPFMERVHLDSQPLPQTLQCALKEMRGNELWKFLMGNLVH